MYRGSTPTVEITLDFDTALIEAIYITFRQCGEDLFEKTIDDCELDGNTVSFKLTQEETLGFNAKNCVYAQARIKLNDGTAMVEDIGGFVVNDIYKDGVI